MQREPVSSSRCLHRAGAARAVLTAAIALAVTGCGSTGHSTATGDTPGTATGPFPIGVWLQSPIRTRDIGLGTQTNAANFKSIGVNAFIGLWQFPDESWAYPGYTEAAVQALADNGLVAYAGSNQVAVDWIAAHPQLASVFQGYVLGDEPDMNKESGIPAAAAASMPDAWQAAGDTLRAADEKAGLDLATYANFGKGFALDPWVGYHVDPGPTQADDFAKYVEPVALMSSDYYAITDPYEALNQHGIWAYGRAVSNTKADAGNRPVYGFVESSAPFPNGKVANNIAAKMPPDLIMPAVWNMIVHGANGIIYFCHDFSGGGLVEDGCLADSGMPAAMQAADASIQTYADVLQSPSIAGTTATTMGAVAVTTLTKHFGGATYVFAKGDGNSSHTDGQAVDATITVPGAGNGHATVLDENRSVSISNHQFTDHFEPYALHIYEF